MRRYVKQFIGTLVGVILSCNLFAEVAIIVHPSNGNSFEHEDIQRIFLDKDDFYPDGTEVVAVGQKSGALVDEFNDKVLDRDKTQLKAYWAKLMFTGKGFPPKLLADDAAVISAVAESSKTIGFVNKSAETDAVKVVATF